MTGEGRSVDDLVVQRSTTILALTEYTLDSWTI